MLTSPEFTFPQLQILENYPHLPVSLEILPLKARKSTVYPFRRDHRAAFREPGVITTGWTTEKEGPTAAASIGSKHRRAGRM